MTQDGSLALKRSTTPLPNSLETSTVFAVGKVDESTKGKMIQKPMLNISTHTLDDHSAPSTASSPGCDSQGLSSDDDEDLQMPQFLYKVRTRKLKLVPQATKKRTPGNMSP